MTDTERRQAAKAFAAAWAGRGDEKQQTQIFWLELLRKVFGVADPEHYISFEVPVKVDDLRTGRTTTKFIDAYIPETKVLVEQKSADIDLRLGEVQSDGSLLRPYQQARRYGGYMGKDRQPRWIVVCNFREFHIHDMNRPNDEPEVLLLSNLEKEAHRLRFLVDETDEVIRREEAVSKEAGEIVGVLYDTLLKQYKRTPPADAGAVLTSLNTLCVRLVFCFYAEDSGVFSRRQFHDYLARRRSNARQALIDLFKILDTDEGRDPYLDEDLLAFPYVNGGLFSDESVIIPRITDEIVDLLLRQASEDFDWSEISPTIFGALFESTLNPETRRSGGMHYTSVQNIHKVIDPLFLDGLREEYAQIETIAVERTRFARLAAFQQKLASLRFLDPACGSGNFLTETYLSLRKLENQIIDELQHGQMVMGDVKNPVKVSISQFYGIEINDFAVSVARAALWIAESQMLQQTMEIVHEKLDFLPLKTNAHIVEGNALRLDWESVVPKNELSYIMGNPPFVGYSLQSKAQKDDILSVYVDEKGKPYKTAGKLDYVSGWYFKASQFMQGTGIRTAFVSTNSITQGEQVAGVWKPLYDRFGIHIDFAYRTFRWDSEANIKAHVHCVIVGFSAAPNEQPRRLYVSERCQITDVINAYLIDAPNVFIESRAKPVCSVPPMTTGNRPADGGHLIIEEEDYAGFIAKEPNAQKYIKKLIGAVEFINNKPRWCLWLVGISPADLRKMPLVLERVEACRQDRLNSVDAGRQKLADTPSLFRETNNPAYFVVVPKVSSQQRRYVPIGFLDGDTIASDLVFIIPDATLYHFGVLTSNVHMAWMRAVCGRLKSDYRYSTTIVYNNFPWPAPTDAQKQKIEQTARAILDARALYPDSSLADLYDETTMPPELRKAHQANDRAVWDAYGRAWPIGSESACVAHLMKMYQDLTT